MTKLGNVPDEERCIATKKMENGETRRCKNPHMVGLTVCMNHGGKQRSAQAKSARVKALREMERFVAPISADDPEADVIYSFEMEFRRTVAKIRFCDEMIAELSTKDMVFGTTKIEQKTATEFTGTDVTKEAKLNAWYELQMRERKHLLEMQKIWISAKLDSKRLEISQQYVILLDTAITKSLARLGLDPTNPEIRQVVREELLALPARASEG
jgi:hypothetical protein